MALSSFVRYNSAYCIGVAVVGYYYLAGLRNNDGWLMSDDSDEEVMDGGKLSLIPLDT
jgi:hypothetical protein